MKKETWIISLLVGLFALAVILSVFQYSAGQKMLSKPDNFLKFGNGIGVLHVYGPISNAYNPGFANDSSVDSLIRQLKAYGVDKRVKAVVVRVNSPGGTVGSSQELYNEILKFKKATKKPVVVSIADIGASGGYWVALAGDRIFANAGSMIGNIGVILKNLDLTEVNKRYGVGVNTFKSGQYKDILSSWRAVSDQDKQVIDALIKSVHNQFIDAVKTGRNFDLRKARRLADGKIYTGEQAQKLGLIDELGGLDEAVLYVAKEAGIAGEPEMIMPEKNWYNLMNFWKAGVQQDIINMLFGSQLSLQ